MLKKLIARILNEPEAMTTLAVLSACQSYCPGICLHCAAETGAAAGVGWIVWWLRTLR